MSIMVTQNRISRRWYQYRPECQETGRSCGHPVACRGQVPISGLSCHRPVDGGIPAAGAARRAGTPPGTAGDQPGSSEGGRPGPPTRVPGSIFATRRPLPSATGDVGDFEVAGGRRHRHAGRRLSGLGGGRRLATGSTTRGVGGGARTWSTAAAVMPWEACHRRRPGDGERPTGGRSSSRSDSPSGPPLLPVAEAAQRLHVGGGHAHHRPESLGELLAGWGRFRVAGAHPRGPGRSRHEPPRPSPRPQPASSQAPPFAASPWPWRPTPRSPGSRRSRRG